ncbi:hypothetical protein BGZ93_001149 [Podila epicladia]|nr:hypothetical protein BGZ92_003194 [Podila epicladia]KAG0084614.1 hypothetical protein BGZ93_001149 [Podila epicladia]
MIDTPELIFLVGQYLHSADLRRCIQVSQLWHETLIPCLWRELDDSEWPWYKMFHEAEDLLDGIDDDIMLPFELDPRLRLSEMIHKYGQHIRRLKIAHVWTLECCLQANLQRVSMLYWRIDLVSCSDIHVNWQRGESISQGLHTHLKCEEPDLDYVEDTNEQNYVSRCFWSLVFNNNNLRLVELQITEFNKVLKLESCNILHPLLASLPWIRTLSNLPMPIASTLQLQNFAPNLDTLTLADRPTAHDFLTVPTAENIHRNLRSLTLYGGLTLLQVCHIFQMFPNLEQIRFVILRRIIDEISYKALTVPIRLESARLRQLDVGSLDWVLYSGLTISFPLLESVNIANLAQFKQLNVLLRNCPSVRSIQVRSVAGPITGYGAGNQEPNTPNANADHNSNNDTDTLVQVQNIQVVHINLNWTQVKGSIKSFWRTVPHLVEVTFRASEPPLLVALARYCPSLQRANVGTMYPWRSNRTRCSNAVSELLRSCSDLRALEGEGLVISPMTIRDGGAWVCHQLEVLHLDITGFADETSETHIDGSDEDERRIALQHVSYDQLAQLTRLRSLDLSIVCLCNAPPHKRAEQCQRHRRQMKVIVGPLNTLQLTLLSGLDRLSSLSQLEELGIRDVEHCIRGKELLWMQEHWPRLKRIRGVAPKNGELQKREVRTWYVEDGLADFLERYPDNL